MLGQSVLHLRKVAKLESIGVKNLIQGYLTGAETGDQIDTPMLQTYFQEFYNANGFSNIPDIFTRDETWASKSPICSYSLLRRLYYYRDVVSQTRLNEQFGEVIKEMVDVFSEEGWPHFKILDRAMGVFLRIQNLHQLTTEMLANGFPTSVEGDCSFNSIICYEIGSLTIQRNKFASAIEWLELAKEKAVVDGRTSIPFIEYSLWDAIEKHNKYFTKPSTGDMDSSFFNRKIRHFPQDSKKVRRSQNRENIPFLATMNYWKLCSGETLQTSREKSLLFCWYEFKIHPMFEIGPKKMEFLSRDPDILQVYDILNGKDMEMILSEKISLYNNPRTTVPTLQEIFELGLETSMDGNFTSVRLEEMVSMKVGHVTGLIMDSRSLAPETLIVNSYSPAGNVYPHHDGDKYVSSEPGTLRMATMLIYISEIDEGGETVFPHIGLASNPVKGSGVLYRNFYPNGEADSFVTHGGCPVLRGEKWLAVKCSSCADEFLHGKCGLNQNDRYQFPVNNVYLPVPKIPRAIKIQKPALPPDPPGAITNYSPLEPKKFKEEFQEQHRNVKMYLDNFEESTLAIVESSEESPYGARTETEKVLWNPLAKFRVVLRFREYIQIWMVQKEYFADTRLKRKILSYLSKVYNISNGPNAKDFTEVTGGIIKIQQVYNLPAEEFASGIVLGISTQMTLNARDCFLLGLQAASMEFHRTSIQWLKLALKLLRDHSDTTVEYEDVLDALVHIQILYEEDFRKEESKDSASYKTSEGSQIEPDESQEVKRFSMSHFEEKELHQICRGELYPEHEDTAKLFCWFPQMELVQYYDIIGDQAIERVKGSPSHNFWSEEDVSDEGSSKDQLWHLKRNGSRILDISLRKLVERITGLNVQRTNHKYLSLSSHLSGAYFPPHMNSDAYTDTIATLLIYLTDVLQGGETVFNSVWLKAVPQRGSAVFMYNLKSCGEPDLSAVHGFCPVVFGEKWVLLASIGENFQSEIKSCNKNLRAYFVALRHLDALAIVLQFLRSARSSASEIYKYCR
ncbi:unnamed protein product, partial [Allacma fusca]